MIFLEQVELNGHIDSCLEVLNLNNLFSPSSIATALEWALAPPIILRALSLSASINQLDFRR